MALPGGLAEPEPARTAVRQPPYVPALASQLGITERAVRLIMLYSLTCDLSGAPTLRPPADVMGWVRTYHGELVEMGHVVAVQQADRP